jgi:hypothetical protein
MALQQEDFAHRESRCYQLCQVTRPIYQHLLNLGYTAPDSTAMAPVPMAIRPHFS